MSMSKDNEPKAQSDSSQSFLRCVHSRRIIREGNRENLPGRRARGGRLGTPVFVLALKGITGSLGRIPQIIPNAESAQRQ